MVELTAGIPRIVVVVVYELTPLVPVVPLDPLLPPVPLVPLDPLLPPVPLDLWRYPDEPDPVSPAVLPEGLDVCQQGPSGFRLYQPVQTPAGQISEPGVALLLLRSGPIQEPGYGRCSSGLFVPATQYFSEIEEWSGDGGAVRYEDGPALVFRHDACHPGDGKHASHEGRTVASDAGCAANAAGNSGAEEFGQRLRAHTGSRPGRHFFGAEEDVPERSGPATPGGAFVPGSGTGG